MTDVRLVVSGISFRHPAPPLAPLALLLDSPVVALYGRNGAGKTRLIDGLRHAAGDPAVIDGDGTLHIQFVGAVGDEEAWPPRSSADLLRRSIRAAVQRSIDVPERRYLHDWPEGPDAGDPSVPLSELTRAVLLSLGVGEALSRAISQQEARILDRSESGYYLAIAARLEGDVARLVDAVPADVDGDQPPWDPSTQIMRNLDTARRRAASDGQWPSHRVLDVIVEEGAVEAPIVTELVPAALGLVTEGALPAALHVLRAELEQLLVSSPVLISGGAVDVEDPVEAVLAEVGEAAGELLMLCLPNAPAVRLRLAPPWRGDDMVLVEAVDQPSGATVPLTHLSAAQARWAALAVQIAVHTRRNPSNNVLLVLDEPDAGLHPTARRAVASGLAAVAQRTAGVAVVATHAAEFLSLPGAQPVHVSRPAAGTQVRPLTPEQLAALDAAAASDLGLSRGEALLLASVFVIVEGEHDKALIETWLADDLRSTRSQIFTLRGTHNLSSLLDSKVLLPLTEAALVIVTDATRPGVGDEWRAVLESGAEKRGGRLHKARKRLEADGAFTDEERRIWQMLESAVQSDLADRVYVHGLLRDDVIEYLHAPAVTRRADASWKQLKLEWRRARQHGQSFKEWLRSRGIDVSTRALAAVAADQPAPDEFRQLGLVLYAAAHGDHRIAVTQGQQ